MQRLAGFRVSSVASGPNPGIGRRAPPACPIRRPRCMMPPVNAPTDAQDVILARNVDAVRSRLQAACRRAGRDPSSVLLLAVTKGRSAETAAALARLGVLDLGENRLHEAAGKAAAVAAPVRWHMIGHLQRNKAAKAAELFSALHSADSLALLEILHRRLAGRAGPPFPVHVQVNVSGEGTKSGLAPGDVPAFLRATAGLDSLRMAGLMTMAPFGDDPEDARPVFRALAALARDAAARGLLPDPPGLSMGMTQDFEVAVEEGSTVVRVGSALFEGLDGAGKPRKIA